MTEVVERGRERARLSRVLIVEDHPSQLRTLTGLLEAEGIETIGVPTGTEALAVLDREEVGIVVVDLRLPDRNGTALLEELRARSGMARIIIHTGYGSFATAKDAVNLGAFAYIEKGEDPQELIRHVHRAREANLTRYAESLEAAVRQRTAELERRYEELRNLHKLVSRLNAAVSVDEVYEAALDAFRRTLAPDRASILLFDPDGVLRFKAWRSLSDEYRQAVEDHFPWKPETPARATAGGADAQPIIVPDIAEDVSIEPYRPAILKEGIRALAFIPLLAQGRLIGNCTLYGDAPRCFTREEVRLAQTIAAHVAFAVTRKQAEEALSERERAMRTLVTSLPGVVYRCLNDPNWTLKYISDQVRDLVGYGPEEFLSSRVTWAQLIHPDDVGRVWDEVQAAVAQARPFQLEYRIRSHDGRELLVWERGQAVMNPDSSVTALEGFIMDITERKQVEQALKSLVEGTSSVTGEAFFPVLAQCLASALDARSALVTELADRSQTRLRALAVWTGDKLGRTFEYDTRGTPCEVVLAQGSAYYPSGVRALFPDDQDLIRLEVDGYLGYALHDSGGEPVGHLCVLTDQPLRIGAQALPIMAIFAARAAAELDRKRANERLQHRLELEKLLARISTHFISLGPRQIDRRITTALESIGRFMGADRSYVFLLSDDGTTMSNTHEWRAAGITSEMAKLQHLPVETFPWWMEQMKRFEPISIPCVADLPAEARAERDILQAQGIQSLIVVPMTKGDALVGFIGFDSVQAPRTWPEEDSTLLRVLGEMFVNALEHQRAEEKRAQLAQDIQLLLDSTGEGIWGVDLEARCMFLNKAAGRMLGYAADEALGKNMHELVHHSRADGSPYPIVECPIIASFRTGRGCRIEEDVFWRRDGTSFPVEYSSFPILEQGTVKGAVVIFQNITERKCAQEALRSSLSTLKALIYSSQSGLLFEDPHRRIVFANPTLCSFFEVPTPESLVGLDSREAARQCSRLFQEPDRFVRCLDETIARGEPVRGDQLTLRDGRIFERDYVAVQTADALIGHLWIYRDVTDRVRAERTLAASEDRYRALYEENPSMYFTLATDGTVLSVNQFGARQLGYAAEELLGRSVLTLFHDDDRPRVHNSLTALLAHPDRVGHWEFRKIRKDGTVLWVKETARVVHHDRGAPVVLVVCEDITDRKQAELALRFSKFTIERVSDAIYWVDPQAKILEVNDAASAMLGYSKEELCAMTVHDINPYFHADMWPDFWATMKQRGTASIETFHQAKDGRLIPIEVNVNYLSYEGKEFHCALVRDITERKQTEEAVRRSYEERERISHDLHDGILQSLYAVGLGLEATKRDVKPASRAMVQRLDGAIVQLNALVREVRSFITRMTTPVEDVRDLAQTLQALTGAFVATGAGDIAVQLDPRVAASFSAEQTSHLVNIIKEALSNSVRHARATHRSVTLGRSRGEIRLEIRDDGIGFRAHQRREAGMGLSTMRARAKKLGGRLSIISPPGRGTRVVLRLPEPAPTEVSDGKT